MITVRCARMDDHDAILAMLGRVAQFSRYTEGKRLNRRHLEATLTRMMQMPNAGFLIAEYEGQPVGLFVLMLSEDLLSGVRLASEVCWWVDREARAHFAGLRGRLGVGLRLLEAGEAWAKAHRVHTLQMLAPEPRFHRLFERRGYLARQLVFERRF